MTDGNLTINATVAASSTTAFGVIISSGGILESTSSGSVTVSGSVTGIGIGVQLQDALSSIRSAGGAIEITGIGGNALTPLNVGVRLLDETTIESTSIGPITVVGTGGTGSDRNYGIEIAQATIRSSGGGVSITGTGQGTDGGNTGVFFSNVIFSDVGSGNVSITGNGSTGGSVSEASADGGIFLLDSQVLTTTGNVTLIGTAAKFNSSDPASTLNIGVELSGNTSVESTGGGDIVLRGTAADPMATAISLNLSETGGSITTTGDVRMTAVTGTISTPLRTSSISNLISANNVQLSGTTDVGDQPSSDANFGIFSIAGNLQLSSSDTLRFEVSGTAAGSNQDQIFVLGGVDLGDATLDLSSTIQSNLGQVITLIDNDLSDPITGNFAGLPEGASLVLDGSIFEISYVGGDGNDVTLTQVDTYTATGDGTDETFTLSSDPSNITLSINGSAVATILRTSVNRFVINSATGDDLLRLDFAGGNPIPAGGVVLDGGVGGNDSMEITGGSASRIQHTFTNENDGSVDIDGSLITYVGLEPILDNLDAIDRVFDFQGADEIITLSDEMVLAGNNTIDSTLGEVDQSRNPTEPYAPLAERFTRSMV